MTLMLPLLLACATGPRPSAPTGSTSAPSTSAPSTSLPTAEATAAAAPPLPAGLIGQPPAAPRALPDFQATNRDGGARAREDLLGHPTVMWFYPAAATAG